MNELLIAQNITKEFSGNKALDNVSFTLEENQIHALCGENGAGKSTLINILSGVYPYGTYSGKIILNGQEMQFHNTADAKEVGISVIHQELSLFNELSVAENLFVGQELSKNGMVQWNDVDREARKWLKKLKLDYVEPATRLGNLGVGKQQLIEIARALISNSRILILDEPTASLTDNEVEVLIALLKELKAAGTSIIYISHKLEETMEIADYVTVLRDGSTVGGRSVKDLTQLDIVQMMVGRTIKNMYPNRETLYSNEVVFELKNCSVAFENKTIVQGVHCALHKGEILGFFGLVGAGRTELMRSVFGDEEYSFTGEVFLNGKKVDVKNPFNSINRGIAYCTEDRKVCGIIPQMTIRENMTISFIEKFKGALSVNYSAEKIAVHEKIDEFKIKPRDDSVEIQNLSGGNQQKVLLSRMLLGDIKVLILDEPTRGIDVGAKQEIYEIMNRLAANGISIIMISSELPEILGMCDNILIMHEGNVETCLDNTKRDVTQAVVMTYATGLGGSINE